jgi:hypothetical protein
VGKEGEQAMTVTGNEPSWNPMLESDGSLVVRVEAAIMPTEPGATSYATDDGGWATVNVSGRLLKGLRMKVGKLYRITVQEVSE